MKFAANPWATAPLVVENMSLLWRNIVTMVVTHWPRAQAWLYDCSGSERYPECELQRRSNGDDRSAGVFERRSPGHDLGPKGSYGSIVPSVREPSPVAGAGEDV